MIIGQRSMFIGHAIRFGVFQTFNEITSISVKIITYLFDARNSFQQLHRCSAWQFTEICYTDTDFHAAILKTDIAFIVSSKVRRINDGSSPKVISKPQSNSVYLAVVFDDASRSIGRSISISQETTKTTAF